MLPCCTKNKTVKLKNNKDLPLLNHFMLLKLMVVGVFVWHKQIEEKMRGQSLTRHVYVRVSTVKVHILYFWRENPLTKVFLGLLNGILNSIKVDSNRMPLTTWKQTEINRPTGRKMYFLNFRGLRDSSEQIPKITESF